MANPTNVQFAVAVHVLTYLASMGDGRPISSDELATSVNASPVYVRRVLTPLRASGLVRSRPGSKGGWDLTCAAESITLAKVWDLIQDDVAVLGLHGPNPLCPIGAGVRRALLDIEGGVADAVHEQLAGHTIADLLARAGGQPAAKIGSTPADRSDANP